MTDNKSSIVRLMLNADKFEILVKPDPALDYKLGKKIDISKQILEHGDVNLTTDQRRRMVEEKKKQIIQYISRNFIDPKTHLPHPPLRIENAMEQIRLVIDPFKRPEEQAKKIIDPLRKILPLKSENLQLVVTVPSQFSAQSYSIIKGIGDLKDEKWLQDGSLKVIIEINAGIRVTFIERINSITKGSAHIQEQ